MELKSSNYSEAFKKFASWVETNEKRLNSACYCCPKTQIQATNETNSAKITNANSNTPQNRLHNWKHVIDFHQNLQTEIEDFGTKLSCETKRHLNDEKETCVKEEWSKVADLEVRWHKIWLKSLEQLVIVERIRRCPQHNSTLIGKPSSPANKKAAKPQRIRPVSYPTNYSERLEWDYRNTLSLTGWHKENGSQIDLDSVDEQITKNLTEFGENYELWFPKEDEIDCIPMHSRPPSVEPAEKPEIAKAIVTSDPNHHQNVNSNLLRLTTPSSMISVDASKYSFREKNKYPWRSILFVLLSLIVLIFSTLYQEPHYMYKSYYRTQPV